VTHAVTNYAYSTKIVEKLRERISARRAKGAERAEEQAELRRAQERRGVPGGETHAPPPDGFGGFGGS
jgi:hypothetical protein